MSDTLTLTMKFPADRRLVIDIPPEFPAGGEDLDVTMRTTRPRDESGKLDRELRAFSNLLPQLLTTHFGRYVAIHDGAVVAHGETETGVSVAAYRSFPGVAIPVRLVSKNPLPPERIRTRRERAVMS